MHDIGTTFGQRAENPQEPERKPGKSPGKQEVTSLRKCGITKHQICQILDLELSSFKTPEKQVSRFVLVVLVFVLNKPCNFSYIIRTLTVAPAT